MKQITEKYEVVVHRIDGRYRCASPVKFAKLVVKKLGISLTEAYNLYEFRVKFTEKDDAYSLKSECEKEGFKVYVYHRLEEHPMSVVDQMNLDFAKEISDAFDLGENVVLEFLDKSEYYKPRYIMPTG